MPNKFVPLHPLDDQGMRSDRPATEVKWTKLENMIIRDGRLVQRPGLRGFTSIPLDTNLADPGTGDFFSLAGSQTRMTSQQMGTQFSFKYKF